MRVLKLAKINKQHRFDCSDCKVTLEVLSEELMYESSSRPGDDAYTFICCACGHKNWVDPSRVKET